MRRLLTLIVLVAVAILGALLLLAAAPPVETPDAGQIAGGLVVAWGLLAPLTIYKWIKADDARMKLITIIAAIVIALVSLILTGQLKLDVSSGATALVTFSMVYGESQLVWNLLKDHPRTTSFVN